MLNNNYEQLVLIKFFALSIGVYFIVESLFNLLIGGDLNYAKSCMGILMLFIGMRMK